MSKALAADTHSAIWYIADSPELSPTAAKAMDEAVDAGEPIYVSAITLIEMTYLIEKGRLPEQKLVDLLGKLQNHLSNFELVPVNLSVTQSLRRIERSEVPDMPDRIIAATALNLNVPLVTRDRKIRAANLTTIW